MRVTFVKTPGAADRFFVTRDDGSEASWSFASYGPRAMPHDLVHFVLEQEMGLRLGLWGRVAAGADLAKVNAQSNRMGGPIADKYRTLGEDLSELLLAEAFAGQAWSADWQSDDERLEALLAAYAEQGITPPEGFGLARVVELREALDGTRARWAGLGEKGSLVLTW